MQLWFLKVKTLLINVFDTRLLSYFHNGLELYWYAIVTLSRKAVPKIFFAKLSGTWLVSRDSYGVYVAPNGMLPVHPVTSSNCHIDPVTATRKPRPTPSREIRISLYVVFLRDDVTREGVTATLAYADRSRRVQGCVLAFS